MTVLSQLQQARRLLIDMGKTDTNEFRRIEALIMQCINTLIDELG